MSALMIPHQWWNEKVENGMEKLGRFVATYPAHVIVVSLVFTVACGPGFMFFKESDEPWVPFGAEALDEQKEYDEIFGTPSRRSSLIYEVEKGNVLDKQHLIKVTQLCIDVETIVGKKGTKFSDVCLEGAHGCVSTAGNLPSVWNYNLTLLELKTQSEILADITGAEAFLGNALAIVQRSPSGTLVSATAVSLAWLTKAEDEELEDDETKSGDWETAFLEKSEDWNDKEGISVWQNAARSPGDEIGGNIRGDVVLVNLALVLIVLYTTAVMFKRDALISRMTLGLQGILSVGLSIVVGYGLGGYFQIPFEGPARVIPFLALGIGVDDMFIIVDAFRRTEVGDFRTTGKEGVIDRIGGAMREAGPSVSMTTMTDLYVFIVSTSTALPALRYFSLYAFLTIFFDFIFQCTFFVACVALDARRINDSRRDCCACCKKSGESSSVVQMKESGDNSVSSVEKGGESEDDMPTANLKPASGDGLANQFVSKVYAPMLVKAPVKIVVVVVTLALLGTAIYGISTLKEEFGLEDLVGGDSYLVDYFKSQERLYPSNTFAVQFIARAGNFEPYSPHRVNHLNDLYNAIGSDIKFDGSPESWFEPYKQFVAANGTYGDTVVSGVPDTQSAFYGALRAWLALPPSVGGGSLYARKISLENGLIKGCAIEATMPPGKNPADDVANMDYVREVAKKSPVDCFPYSRDFANYETARIITSEAIQNIGLSLVGVAAVMFIYVHPVAGVAVFGAVLLIFTDLLGFAALLGVNLNSVAVANLVIAIGLSVDYAAHIAHKFTVTAGISNNDRLLETLETMGTSVFNGGTTTLLGIAALGFAKSGVFLVFFKMLFLTCLFGMFHGLVALPVILSLVLPENRPAVNTVKAPGSLSSADDDED